MPPVTCAGCGKTMVIKTGRDLHHFTGPDGTRSSLFWLCPDPVCYWRAEMADVRRRAG